MPGAGEKNLSGSFLCSEKFTHQASDAFSELISIYVKWTIFVLPITAATRNLAKLFPLPTSTINTSRSSVTSSGTRKGSLETKVARKVRSRGKVSPPGAPNFSSPSG
jgi:hypothetical protein